MSEDINNEKFKEILNASYQPQAEASATLSKAGYAYDPDLSTMESKVFIDPKTNKPNIVYRGSTRVSDFLIEDPALAFGIKTEKQRNLQKMWKQNTDKVPMYTDIVLAVTVRKKAELLETFIPLIKVLEYLILGKRYQINKQIFEHQKILLVHYH